MGNKEKKTDAELTPEELERQETEELPDREVMSVVLPPDPFKVDPDVFPPIGRTEEP